VSWLITGGAGYIGAHVVSAMREAGQQTVVLDDLSSGSADRIPDVPLVVGDVLDGDLLRHTFRHHAVEGVVHLAAKKAVEESVRRPLHYYRQNVEGLRVLLQEATDAGVCSVVFSSSAAVYGSPDVDLVDEDTDCRPVNPYGMTKLVGERMVEAVAEATGLRYANLRYFNVAGAGSPALADRGVDNLVPMVLRQLARRLRPSIFGDDYTTPDGTCIRDYVHVIDVASAHVAAAAALAEGRLDRVTANVGRGQGVSVRAMVETIRRVSGTAGEDWSEPEVRPRRPGDPPRVVAAADRMRDLLGWQAQHTIEDMVASAWDAWCATATPVPASEAMAPRTHDERAREPVVPGAHAGRSA
jgi:UDP-glucose 4-epimerase